MKKIIGMLITIAIIVSVFTGCSKMEDGALGFFEKVEEADATKDSIGNRNDNENSDQNNNGNRDNIDTATLQGAVQDSIKALNESTEYEINMYMEDIKDENKMIGVGYSKKEGLYYMHVPMLGIPSIYLNYDTNQLYYYDETQGGWFVSENDGNVESEDSDYVKNDLSSYYQGFTHILSAEYVGEKNLNGTDYYVLEVETASETPEIIYEDGCAIVPTPDGGTIYVYEGGSSTYGDIEYTFADDGSILANGEPYAIDESFSQTYVSQAYISKDTLKLFAIGAEDEFLGNYYLVFSINEIHIPAELASAEKGSFADYLVGFGDPEVEYTVDWSDNTSDWTDNADDWNDNADTTMGSDITGNTDSEFQYADYILIKGFSHQLKIGQSCDIEISVMPEGYTINDLIYSSDDSSIASVNDGGQVTANKEGSVKIRVQTSDGKYSDYTFFDVQNP